MWPTTSTPECVSPLLGKLLLRRALTSRIRRTLFVFGLPVVRDFFEAVLDGTPGYAMCGGLIAIVGLFGAVECLGVDILRLFRRSFERRRDLGLRIFRHSAIVPELHNLTFTCRRFLRGRLSL